MKKIVSLLVVAVIFSCTKKEVEGYNISGTLTGFNADEMIYVNKVSDANRPIVIDSVQLINGKFEISLPKVESRDFNFLTFNKSTKGNILLIAENAKIEVVADKDDLRGATIKGGKENTVFSDFLNEIKKQNTIESEVAQKNAIARQAGDYEALKEVKRLTDSLNTARKEIRLKVINENPNTVSGVMALSDLISFKMLRATEAQAFFDKLPADIKDSRLGRSVDTAIKSVVEVRNNIGDSVLDFNAPTPSGEQLNLKNSLGKLTILDFWASWCRPCRMENPNVVRVYNKYKSKGLEIIGISFDQSKEKWKSAIEQDGLTWKHVSNLKGWQEPLGKPFGVRSIPVTYLLDEKGVIIAKNLRGQELENKIEQLLK